MIIARSDQMIEESDRIIAMAENDILAMKQMNAELDEAIKESKDDILKVENMRKNARLLADIFDSQK